MNDHNKWIIICPTELICMKLCARLSLLLFRLKVTLLSMTSYVENLSWKYYTNFVTWGYLFLCKNVKVEIVWWIKLISCRRENRVSWLRTFEWYWVTVYSTYLVVPTKCLLFLSLGSQRNAALKEASSYKLLLCFLH